MNVLDGLKNIVANLGTGRDKAAHNHYVFNCQTPEQLLAMYRSSWAAKAIVEYPAKDSTRNWRNWRAKEDQITKIEALEKYLGVKKAVYNALIASRLFGGAAIYINTQDSKQDQPLKLGREIKSLVVLSNLVLRPKEIVKDINSPYYGKAELYALQTSSGKEEFIHASRLVLFAGSDLPVDAASAGFVFNDGWGDSVLSASKEAIEQYDSVMANVASLVFEAKINVFKFEGFADLVADPANDAMLTRRLQSQAAMKSINGDVVIDMKDDFLTRTASFGGLTEIIAKEQENVAGSAGIPVTRLFGRSAAGLSGSGDGDERVYYDSIKQEQENDIGPAMALLDDCLIYQALGSRPAEIFYEWAPLRQTSKQERAEVFGKVATAARQLAGSNAGELLPIDALSEALANELTELGVLPGLDQAIKKFGTLAEQNELEQEELLPIEPLINSPQENEGQQ